MNAAGINAWAAARVSGWRDCPPLWMTRTELKSNDGVLASFKRRIRSAGTHFEMGDAMLFDQGTHMLGSCAGRQDDSSAVEKEALNPRTGEREVVGNGQHPPSSTESFSMPHTPAAAFEFVRVIVVCARDELRNARSCRPIAERSPDQLDQSRWMPGRPRIAMRADG